MFSRRKRRKGEHTTKKKKKLKENSTSQLRKGLATRENSCGVRIERLASGEQKDINIQDLALYFFFFEMIKKVQYERLVRREKKKKRFNRENLIGKNEHCSFNCKKFSTRGL